MKYTTHLFGKRGLNMNRSFNAINHFIAVAVGLIVMFALLFLSGVARAEEWKITAYCACSKCTAPYDDGIFASGKPVYVGGVAVNWLPFGTKMIIDGTEYTVEDRGAKSIFGSKGNPKKAVDIYFESHEQALRFGVAYLSVQIK